jgi:heptaprenyl diphosphate synthase
MKLAQKSLFLCIAVILAYFEAVLPPFIPLLPFIKLGLSNIIILLILIVFSFTDAIIINIIKCLLIGILSGNISQVIYSIPSGTISLLIQYILYKYGFPKIRLIFISIIGSITYNLIQIVLMGIIYQTNLFYTLPLILLLSIITGVIVGVLLILLIKHIPFEKYCLQTE